MALDIVGMMELNVFETSTSFRSVTITQPVTITIPITSLSDEFSAGDFMDAWYFNEEHGKYLFIFILPKNIVVLLLRGIMCLPLFSLDDVGYM